MMGTTKKIGGNVSKEAAAAAAAERALDPKIAIFKVQPFLNQVEFGHAIFFVRALRRPLKQFETRSPLGR